MPIKPENKHRYPPNWKEIRERIKARAKNRCEGCDVPNGAFRIKSGEWTQNPLQAETWHVVDGEKVTKIVCTTAHLDHIPEHCDDDNLKFWCQRCHLAHDHHHHMNNARRTRRSEKAMDMFEGDQ